MNERLNTFVALSAVLTGFSQVQLLGSGVAGQHLGVLDEVLPAEIVSALFDAFCLLPAEPARDAALTQTILDDARLGPVARNLIVLWYSGTWTQLPVEWRSAHGAVPQDTTRTTSGDAYRAGLQWIVAGAHPPGASHQGFGAWSLEPKRRLA